MYAISYYYYDVNVNQLFKSSQQIFKRRAPVSRKKGCLKCSLFTFYALKRKKRKFFFFCSFFFKIEK